MTRPHKPLLLLLSIIFGLTALFAAGVLVLQHTGQPISAAAKIELADPFSVPAAETFVLQKQALTGRESLPLALAPAKQSPVIEFPSLKNTPEAWMRYDGMDLNGTRLELWFDPACAGNPLIALPAFTVHPWYPEVFSDGTFAVGQNNAVAWDNLGFTGIWMHSGLDWLNRPQAAYPLHDFLERDVTGELRNPVQFEEVLQNCLLQSQVRLKAGEEVSYSHVSVALRVPAVGVPELSGHVMDLVPYLSQAYPEAGFDQLQEGALILYFCGRRLATEEQDPQSYYWAQARIIIAIEPNS